MSVAQEEPQVFQKPLLVVLLVVLAPSPNLAVEVATEVATKGDRMTVSLRSPESELHYIVEVKDTQLGLQLREVSDLERTKYIEGALKGPVKIPVKIKVQQFKGRLLFIDLASYPVRVSALERQKDGSEISYALQELSDDDPALKSIRASFTHGYVLSGLKLLVTLLPVVAVVLLIGIYLWGRPKSQLEQATSDGSSDVESP